MTEYVTTHVTRVNINKICLLIKDMYDSAQVLSVNTDNTTEYQMSRKHISRMLPSLVVMKNYRY
jgi:hypothetical protein